MSPCLNNINFLISVDVELEQKMPPNHSCFSVSLAVDPIVGDGKFKWFLWECVRLNSGKGNGDLRSLKTPGHCTRGSWEKPNGSGWHCVLLLL